jgi:hypothetical protein
MEIEKGTSTESNSIDQECILIYEKFILTELKKTRPQMVPKKELNENSNFGFDGD